MPYLRVNYRSDYVGRKDISIYYPQKAPSADPGDARFWEKDSGPLPQGGQYQVLYLIHGRGGDFSDIPLNSTIMKACEEAHLLVVMPTVQDFADEKLELGKFYDYVSEELYEFICNIFPVSPLREDNFIAGFSIGGYFAYRIALNNPNRFSCVGSFSSPLDNNSDIKYRHKNQSGYPMSVNIEGTDKDVLYAALKLKKEGAEAPKMFQACGFTDITWKSNLISRDLFCALEFDHTWVEANGIHSYNFFNSTFTKFLEWLPLKRGPVFPVLNIPNLKGRCFL